jgi:branched-chain amino acid transport system ATP-binding protein
MTHDAITTDQADPSSLDQVLTAEGVVRRFGGNVAVDVDRIGFRRGVFTSLIGPNGAGTSTFLNLLTGFERPDEGEWALDGRPLTGLTASEIARRGLIRTFQHTRPLPELTVLENLMLPLADDRDESLLRAPFRRWRRREVAGQARAEKLMEEFRLGGHRDAQAGSRSGGQRRLVEIARALLADPQVLLLDEPMAGVNPVLREFIGDRLVELTRAGLTVVMVEHDMPSVMRLSDHVICMGEGRVIAEGTAREVSEDSRVIDAYLGQAAGSAAPRTSTTTARRRQQAQQSPAGDGFHHDQASLLTVQEVTAGYVPAVDILTGCSVEVGQAEVVSIVGPNGAGKSTLLKLVFGLLAPRTGKVIFDGADVSAAEPGELVRQGIGFVPQLDNVFPSLTIRENLRMGCFLDRKVWDERYGEIANMFPMVGERSAQRAGSLSGGERQVLAVARALIMKPRLLLLDEPSAGLSPVRMDDMFEMVGRISASGVSILLVEQNARRALEISDHAYVLAEGRNAHEGHGLDLLDDPQVAALYLGAAHGS